MPTCCACHRSQPRDAFARSQLKKPADRRRCLGCAAGGAAAASAASSVTSAAPATAAPSAPRGSGGAAPAPASSAPPGPPIDWVARLRAGPTEAERAEIEAEASAERRDFRHFDAIPDPAPAAEPSDDEVAKLLDSLLEAGRMTKDEYRTAKLDGASASSRKRKDELLAEWKPLALSLPCRVTVHGLVARPDLNGRRGVAVSWVKESGRYGVEFDSPSRPGAVGQKLVAIRPANLREDDEERLLPPNAKPTHGRCWDGHLWGSGRLRCDGRIPLQGEVCYILDGPYSGRTEREAEDLERGSGEKDRRAAAVVFTYEGWAHLLKSPDLGGTSMLVEAARVRIAAGEHTEVCSAFAVDDGNHLLVLLGNLNVGGDDRRLALLEYPTMKLVKWLSDSPDEFSDIRLVDYFEDTLAVLYHSEDRPSKDLRLCCFRYGDASLERLASWSFTGELGELQTQLGRICDLCVACGGAGARIATLSCNGLVRLWSSDSVAGCTAIMNGSLENLGGAGKVGGLPQKKDCGRGIIKRVPRVMAEQLDTFHDLDGVDIVTCHRGTLSFWQTSLSKYRSPERLMSVTNPMADIAAIDGFFMDEGFSTGVGIQFRDDLCIVDEDEGEREVAQLVIWSPFRKAAVLAFEIPAKYEIPSNGVLFSGGRLLIASGLEDVAKSAERGEELEYGKETCYLYVVSARDGEAQEDSRSRIGIDSRGVPGILENLIAGSTASDLPPGIDISIALPHAHPGDGIPAAREEEVRPCCHLCHGCGRFVCMHNLRRCTGCHGAFYCSNTCQKKAWKMHKPSCKATQHLMKWFKEQGYNVP